MSESNEDIIKGALGKGRIVDSSQRATASLAKECDGVDLFGEDKSNEIGFDQIKKGRRYKEKKGIELWGNQDFVLYIKRLHMKHLNSRLQIKMPPACVYIQRIQDVVLDILGYCDNIVLKDYCDFFFQRYAERLSAKYNGYHFAQMLYSNVIVEFANQYRYRSQKPVPQEKQCVSAENVENAYVRGAGILLRDFGLIIAANWMIVKEGYSKEAAERSILESLKKTPFEIVRLSTERWNPYPDWLPFTEAKSLARKADNSFNVTVMISGDLDQKFSFLRRNTKTDV